MFQIRQIFFLVVFSLVSAPLMASTMTITGTLPKDLSRGYFDITVDITGVENAAVLKGAADSDKFVNRIDLYLDDHKDDAVPYTSDGEPTQVDFYITEQDRTEGTDDDGKNQFTYVIRVTEREKGALTTLYGSNTHVKVSVEFYLGDASREEDPEAKKEEVQLERDVAVANDLPSFASPAASGIHESIRVYWQHKASITGYDGTATAVTRPTTYVSVFLVDRSVGDLTFPAKTFNATSDEDTTCADCCTYSVAAVSGTSCITCSAENTYIDANSAASLSGVKVLTVLSSEESTSFSGLVNDDEYSVFLMYQPDGIQRSACYTAIPSADMTFTEANGGKDASPTKIRCFIATAAYGNSLHGDLKYFRWLRDSFLVKSEFGREFIKAYYQYSPPVADVIAENELLRELARANLWVFARILEFFHE